MHINSLSKNEHNSSLSKYEKKSTFDFENIMETKANKVPINTKNASFTSLGPFAPDSVKEAWIKASKLHDVNGFGLTSKGKFNHITAMLTLQINQIYKNGNSDLLGDSISSAISATEKALDLLNNPLNARFSTNTPDENTEKAFYETFLKYLKEIN